MACDRANKEDANWRRCLSRRLGRVHAAKAFRECQTNRPRPPTPDPSDRSVSERRWEWQLRKFRRELRNSQPRCLPGESQDPAQKAQSAPNFLIGTWEDHQGSIYEVMPGRKGWLHVATTRPSGETRFTRNLIRSVIVGGQEMATWGKGRYELKRDGQHELHWCGLVQDDIFVWQKLRM